MSWFEILLLLVGVIVFVVSFILPDGKKGETKNSKLLEQDMKDAMEKEISEAKRRIDEGVEETVTYSMEKSERALDRLTNEKIMAVNEYSDTVLSEIRKNHEEVVFLYSMLNDKHNNLKSTAKEVEQKAEAAKEAAKEAGEAAKEVGEAAKVARDSVKDSVKDAAEEVIPEIISEAIPETISAEEVKPLPKQPEKKILTDKERKKVMAEKNAKTKATDHAQKISLEDMPQVPANEGGRNNNAKILKMHKQGRSNMAIAKELGLGIGEVKLVIDLYRQAK